METNSNKRTKLWLFLMKLGARTGCHQMYERSFHIKGYQFPVCARCTGLLAGELIGIIFRLAGALFHFPFEKYDFKFFLIPCLLSIILLGIDGVGQLYGYWVSNNLRRLVTGLLCGLFTMNMFIYVLF